MPENDPSPTDRDMENAALRAKVAARQAEEYEQVLSWALAAFGPGWLPSHRHFLVDKDDEERFRQTGERPPVAVTVYTVRHEETGASRHFTVSEEGKVKECSAYEDGFGPMLLEPHPTRGFEHDGKWCRTHRYSLCWAPFELYHPKSAEELAKLRAGREQRRAEREARRWAEENPLLAWAERSNREGEGPEAEGQGR